MNMLKCLSYLIVSSSILSLKLSIKNTERGANPIGRRRPCSGPIQVHGCEIMYY